MQPLSALSTLLFNKIHVLVIIIETTGGDQPWSQAASDPALHGGQCYVKLHELVLWVCMYLNTR